MNARNTFPDSDTPVNTMCLLREVAPNDFQYVPISEVPASTFVAGERTFTGLFRGQKEKLGPSGSHTRTICLPAGQIFESTLQL